MIIVLSKDNLRNPVSNDKGVWNSTGVKYPVHEPCNLVGASLDLQVALANFQGTSSKGILAMSQKHPESQTAHAAQSPAFKQQMWDSFEYLHEGLFWSLQSQS